MKHEDIEQMSADEQYNTRISYEEKWEKEYEERDAREFARLQAKFGTAK